MIDYIQCKVEEVPTSLLKARDKALVKKQTFTWNDIDFVPEYTNNCYIKKYIAKIEGIRIELYDNTLKISNSLHICSNKSSLTRKVITILTFIIQKSYNPLIYWKIYYKYLLQKCILQN